MNRCTTLAILALMAGCGSNPEVKTPTGANRKPINTEEGIAAYRAGAAMASDAENAKLELDSTLTATGQQVKELQAYLMAKAIVDDNNRIRGLAVTSSSTAKDAIHRSEPIRQTIRDRDVSVTYTSFFEPGKQAYVIPAGSSSTDMLNAAQRAARIEVRGYTDNAISTPASEAEARGRADQAAKWLVSKGVPRSRIEMSYSGAGNFAVENNAEGRGVNRRVEVEIFFKPKHVVGD